MTIPALRLAAARFINRAMSTVATPPAPAVPERLVSLDVYRGFVMLLMASSGLRFGRVAREFPEFGTAVFGVLSRRLDGVMGDLEAARQQFETARSFRNI